MKHYLNVCDIKGSEVQPVDVVTFGSPCQSLSIAGKREGLKHTDKGDDETTRSGLFVEAVRIIKEMREESERHTRADDIRRDIQPRYAVWENVPGAFSSCNGQDFRTVLELLARIAEPEISIPMPDKGKWKTAGEIIGDSFSIAWRVLDAQFFGIPQRRRRIFLVADFAGHSAGEILFKPACLPWHIEKSGEAWKRITGDPSESIRKASE